MCLKFNSSYSTFTKKQLQLSNDPSHGVGALVKTEPPTISESLSALAASVGLLSCVDTEMSRQSPGVAEASVAHAAAVGPLSGMNALMDLEMLHAVEIPAAQRAMVRAPSRGKQAVFGVLVRVFGVDETAMARQFLLEEELLAADFAGVPGCSVGDLVRPRRRSPGRAPGGEGLGEGHRRACSWGDGRGRRDTGSWRGQDVQVWYL